MSVTARRGALALGFDASGVVSLLQGMERTMFKKSMTTRRPPRLAGCLSRAGFWRGDLREIPGWRCHWIHGRILQGKM